MDFTWNNWTAGAYLAGIFGMPVLLHYRAEIQWRLQRRARMYAHRRALRTDRPFHVGLLKPDERRELTNAHGRTADQWMREIATDFVAGRRKHMPTCGEYYAEFGAAMEAYHREVRAR